MCHSGTRNGPSGRFQARSPAGQAPIPTTTTDASFSLFFHLLIPSMFSPGSHQLPVILEMFFSPGRFSKTMFKNC